MGKNIFAQNAIKICFLVFYLHVKINCNDVSKNNTHNETFSKHYTIFNKEIKKKFLNTTEKIITTKYNIILKSKYNEIKIKYESISKIISILEKLITENNWNQDNENKFNKEIQNFENNCTQFNLLFTSFNKSFAHYKKVYKELKKFLKHFFTILFVIAFIALACIAIISFFVIRSQRRYYQLKEEISLHVDTGKKSENVKIKQKMSEKREVIKIKEPELYYGSSSRVGIKRNNKNIPQTFSSDFGDKSHV